VDGTEVDRQPTWSPSRDLVYFQSDRDGTRCIWAQRIDPATRKAVGPPFAAHHLNQLPYYLNDLREPAAAGVSAVDGQILRGGRDPVERLDRQQPRRDGGRWPTAAVG
jgi:eukaryotic-like serine/threonine-protein kinase